MRRRPSFREIKFPASSSIFESAEFHFWRLVALINFTMSSTFLSVGRRPSFEPRRSYDKPNLGQRSACFDQRQAHCSSLQARARTAEGSLLPNLGQTKRMLRPKASALQFFAGTRQNGRRLVVAQIRANEAHASTKGKRTAVLCRHAPERPKARCCPN